MLSPSTESGAPRSGTPAVAILLSAFNGERYLSAQLESLLRQTHESWCLYWRDDGSADRSRKLLCAFASGPAAGRAIEVPGPGDRQGAARSFLILLAAAKTSHAVAFADQDDVWLPDKLARGIAALAAVPPEAPALYCARQTLVDAKLRRLGPSHPFCRPPGFPAALTQNVVTGCTAILNRAATSLVIRSRPPPSTLHDWWSYLVVAAAGGRIIADPEPAVLYRQHGANLIGAPDRWLQRAKRALQRGPRPFMATFRENVSALIAEPDLLSPEALRVLAIISTALAAPPWQRLAALTLPGLFRQTALETALFRLWFLLG